MYKKDGNNSLEQITTVCYTCCHLSMGKQTGRCTLKPIRQVCAVMALWRGVHMGGVTCKLQKNSIETKNHKETEEMFSETEVSKQGSKVNRFKYFKGRVWAAQPTPLKAPFSAPPPIPWLTGDMFLWKWLCRLWYDFPLFVKIAFRTWLSTLGILKHTDSLGSWWSHGTKFLTFRTQSHIVRSTSLITWTIGYVT